MNEVEGVPRAGKEAGEVGGGNGDGAKIEHFGEDHGGSASGGDGDADDGEVGEVLEAGKPQASEVGEGGDAGEKAEGSEEGRREAPRGSDRAVDEGEGAEGGEGAQGGGGDVEVWGAVGEAEGDEVTEWLVVVASSGVAKRRGGGAGVDGDGEAQGLKSRELAGVEGGPARNCRGQGGNGRQLGGGGRRNRAGAKAAAGPNVRR